VVGQNNMRIAQEEVFESVFSIIKFKDQEAVANDIRFGLAIVIGRYGLKHIIQSVTGNPFVMRWWF
jgi:hypothetical protein